MHRTSLGRRFASPLLLVVPLLAGCGPDNTGGGTYDFGVGGGKDLAGADLAGADLSVPPGVDLAMSLGDLAGTGLDGPSAYGDLGKSDSGGCAMGQMGIPCPNPIAPNAGCMGVEDCGANGSGNGLDDNCDGKVDETCSCAAGAVERCFLGPPGKHNVGACTDGQQTCQGNGEFGGVWGPCVGSIGPAAELCDKLDNDCNGCADDGLCCGGVLDCPGPNDPRIKPVPPYTDVQLQGGLFYTGPAMTWSWTVQGGPCDQLFAKTTGNPPVQSFTVTGANMQNATVHFTLSGDYTITMTVTDPQGNVFTCTWVQHVIGPGVRFELCWDHTGKSGMGGADLDLHVHKPGSTTKWFGMPMKPNLDDCNFSDCNPDAWILNCGFGAGNCSKWGYAVSALAQCSGAPPTENGSSWANDNAMCPNPRLDLDNIDIVGRPENANIDDPKNGDTFRAMVHYYGQDSSISINNVEEHPIVNIYCGGTLKSTFGQAPNTLTGFNNGAGWAAGLMWRVADVTAVVDNMGNTTDCTVTQLHPNGQNMGFDVTTNDTTY